MIEVISSPPTIGSRYTPDRVGETPCTTCRNSGRKEIEPNNAKPAARLIAALTRNTGLRNSRSGSTGSAARRSASHQPTMNTTDAANSPMISGEPQGYVVPPHDVASTTVVAKPASRTAPR